RRRAGSGVGASRPGHRLPVVEPRSDRDLLEQRSRVRRQSLTTRSGARIRPRFQGASALRRERGMTFPRTPTFRTALALAAGLLATGVLAPGSSSAALAPAHVNNVSPAAKAAIDKYAKLVYRPTDAGMKSSAGTVTLGDDAHPLARFTFTA